jgi:hypothetical protein
MRRKSAILRSQFGCETGAMCRRSLHINPALDEVLIHVT